MTQPFKAIDGGQLTTGQATRSAEYLLDAVVCVPDCGYMHTDLSKQRCPQCQRTLGEKRVTRRELFAAWAHTLPRESGRQYVSGLVHSHTSRDES